MEVVASKFSGFCNGVSASISLLEREVETGGSVFLSSELVHNNLVSKKFLDQNVHYLNDILDENGFVKAENLVLAKESTLVIAAHGMPYLSFLKIKDSFRKIVDATCPIVQKRECDIRSALNEDKNEVILLVKNTSHSEVKTISDNLDKRIHFIKLGDDVALLSTLDKRKTYDLHTQTTFPPCESEKYINYLKENGYNFEVKSRICPSCEERQKDCANLAYLCSIIIVVGSSHSSNANELVNIAKKSGKEAYLVENIDELDKIPFKKGAVVGLISSASSSEKTFNAIKKKLEALPL